MRHGRVLIDHSEPSLAFCVEVKIEMTYVLYISLRATMCVVSQGVQAQVDVGSACIVVAQPGLKLGAGDLLGGGDSLHRLPRLTISQNYSQPILGFKILLDVTSRHRLGLRAVFVVGSGGDAGGVVGIGTRMSRRRITNTRVC